MLLRGEKREEEDLSSKSSGSDFLQNLHWSRSVTWYSLCKVFVAPKNFKLKSFHGRMSVGQNIIEAYSSFQYKHFHI